VYLARGGHADSTFFEAIDAEADELGARVREACRAMPDPAPMSMFDHVYSGSHSILDAERAQYVAYRDSFEAEAVTR
jgi:pyruvate dehydrogenase E1 component alpha subunit